MKTNVSRWQRSLATLRRHGRAGWRRLGFNAADDEPTQPTVLDPAPPPRLNALERIRDYLRRRGLGQEVTVRPETTGAGFLLEDADGYVHAKDYDDAVGIIDRMWLYQR